MLDITSLSNILSIIIGSLGGSGGTLLYNYLRSKSQDRIESKKIEQQNQIENKKIDLAEDQQIFNFYKTLVETLNSSVLQMRNQISQLDLDHQECTKKNASLLIKIENLEDKVKSLEERLVDYDKKTN